MVCISSLFGGDLQTRGPGRSEVHVDSYTVKSKGLYESGPPFQHGLYMSELACPSKLTPSGTILSGGYAHNLFW